MLKHFMKGRAAVGRPGFVTRASGGGGPDGRLAPGRPDKTGRGWGVVVLWAGVWALALGSGGGVAQPAAEAPPAFPPPPTNRPARFSGSRAAVTNPPPAAATNLPGPGGPGTGQVIRLPGRPVQGPAGLTNVPALSRTGAAGVSGITNQPQGVLTGAPPVVSTSAPAPAGLVRTGAVGPTNVGIQQFPPRGVTNVALPSRGGAGGGVQPAGAGVVGPAGAAAGGPVPGRAAGPAGVAPSMAEAITPGSTNVASMAADELLPKGYLTKMQSAPLEQVLQLYSLITGRIVLRPNQLPAQAITLDALDVELTRAEAIQALDSVLTLNGITMVPMGEKFVTAVPSQSALQEGAAFSAADPGQLPEASQYVTKIVKLQHVDPSEVQPIIQSFAKLPNGILAIDGTRTLVLRDYAANIKRMTEIIKELDVQIESEYKLEVIPIKYGKVEDIYSTMSSLTGGGGGGLAAGTGVRGRGSRLGGGRSGGALRGRTQLQTRQPALGQPAQQVQTGGASSFQQRLQQIASRAAGGEGQLLRDARIVPDERSNSLIVYASKEDLAMITNIVDKVDRLLAQVLIEAIIMDVKLTDNKEFGVSLLMNPQRIGRVTSVAGSKNGPDIATNLTASGLPSAFSYFGRYGGDLDMAVKALAANGRGQVLQTPRIQTSHAIPASFFTGETVPYVTSTYYGGYGYGPSSSFQQLEVGIGLDVTPYITPDGLVVMDITQTIEEISGSTEISGVGKIPNTSRREATTVVSVQDRDTILLGGYIRTAKTKSNSGVPLLKDIPLLGNLFRSSSEDNARSELIVLLRPTVLKTPKDAAIMATAERDRLPGVREMEKAMGEEEQVRHDKADKATGRKRGERAK